MVFQYKTFMYGNFIFKRISRKRSPMSFLNLSEHSQKFAIHSRNRNTSELDISYYLKNEK